MANEESTNTVATTVPAELYTTKTLFTLGGSSAGVWLFTVVLNHAFGISWENHRWIGLIVALTLSFVGAKLAGKFHIRVGTVAFFNGLLIYVTTVGINTIEQGLGDKNTETSKTQNASLIPWASNRPWWPATVLTDSITELHTTVASVNVQLDSSSHSRIRLSDSLRRCRESMRTAKPSDNSKLIAELNNANTEIGNLKAELEKLKAKGQVSAVGPAAFDATGYRQKVTEILGDCLTANEQLMKDIDKYLTAGNMKPKEQMDALQALNDRVYELKNDTKVYNKVIKGLIVDANK